MDSRVRWHPCMQHLQAGAAHLKASQPHACPCHDGTGGEKDKLLGRTHAPLAKCMQRGCQIRTHVRLTCWMISSGACPERLMSRSTRLTRSRCTPPVTLTRRSSSGLIRQPRQPGQPEWRAARRVPPPETVPFRQPACGSHCCHAAMTMCSSLSARCMEKVQAMRPN